MGKRNNVLFVLEEDDEHAYDEEPTPCGWEDRTEPAPSALILGSALRQPAGLRRQPSKEPTVEANRLRRERQNRAAVAKIQLVAQARERPRSRARSLSALVSIVSDPATMTHVFPIERDEAARECLFLILFAAILFVSKDLIRPDALLESLRLLAASSPELVATAQSLGGAAIDTVAALLN